MNGDAVRNNRNAFIFMLFIIIILYIYNTHIWHSDDAKADSNSPSAVVHLQTMGETWNFTT